MTFEQVQPVKLDPVDDQEMQMQEEEEVSRDDPDYHAKIIQKTFRERCAKLKATDCQVMVERDKLEYDDPQSLSEFSQAIFQNLLKQEEIHKISPPDYLKKVQTEIKDTQRAFLLEWIIDVHRKFKLRNECLYVNQFVIDSFLSKKKISNKQLHILGVASLLIATKYEEIYPPELRDLLAISENKFTKQQVTELERDILQTLDFKVTAPSAYRFLQRYRRLSSVMDDDEVFFYAQFILEISLLEASFLKFKPSELAAASIILSAKQLKSIECCWTSEVEQMTGYKFSALSEVIKEVRLFCHEINPKFISILKYKFSKAEYLKVANHSFKF